MKRLYALLLMLLFIAACSTSDSDKDPNPAVPADGTLSIASASVRGYELAVIQVEGHTLAKQEYDLEIGTRKVKAVKNMDNSLTLLVPGDLPTGTHAVRADFAKDPLELTIAAPAAIADPVAYVTEFLGDLDQDIADYKASTGAATVPVEMSRAKEELGQAMQRFGALPAAEQLAAAQIIQANDAYFIEAQKAIAAFNATGTGLGRRQGDPGAASGPSLRTGDWDDCTSAFCVTARTIATVAAAASLVKVGAVAGTIGVGVLGFDAAMSFVTGKKSFTFSYLSRILMVALDLAYWAPTFTLKVTLDRAERELASGLEMRTAADELRILKGEPFTIAPRVTFRTLRAEDAASQSALIKEAVTLLEKARRLYTQTLGSPFGPFPGYAVRSETVATRSLGDWEVKVLDNPSVTVTKPTGKADRFSVTFNSSSRAEQAFTFAVTYRNELEESTRTYKAILVPQRRPHALFLSSGDNQSAAPGKALPSPLKAKVTDVNGKGLEGVEVEWSMKRGGGVLSAARSVTDAYGIAQVAWTLGGTGEQEVEALARKVDGTPLAGAPVLFSAKALSECELGAISAPVITKVEFACDASNGVSILVSFRANGSGVLTSGSYYGHCPQEQQCYPVRLYFWSPGAWQWENSSNGYDARLKSGTPNEGVVEIRFKKSCLSGKTPLETMKAFYPSYKWQIELMNRCNQRSARYSFDT
ncbi:Ig-like domain-containing protein [Pontibacter roseus]|uniref:Ig-like domain-containing protein n=1 Tax=Pontibacter roseus TaxID=336989 RepID=UPI00036753EB|nr:Ig-like domain-containing protein [Pontibacter roseus]